MDKNFDDTTRGRLIRLLVEYNRNFMIVKASSKTSIYTEGKDIDIISDLTIDLVDDLFNQHGFSFRKNEFFNHVEYILYTDLFDIVSLDLLTNLARKGYEIPFEWEKELIDSELVGNLRYCSKQLMFSYAQMFYLLNNSTIPSHYVEEGLVLKEYKFSWILYLRYLGYSFKSIIESFSRNYRLSFSGPDGSGKTDLIDFTIYYLRDGFGRDVIYKRHRPFILPMLSRFLGKSVAFEHGNFAPIRSETPKKGLNMICRYFYYWLDYQLGHLGDFLKYGLLGKIVIYDRFYFDFICDPERSNLFYNNIVARIFKSTIIRPRVNILLLVDAKRAFERKGELELEDYQLLHDRYVALWRRLGMEIIDNNGPKHRAKREIKKLLINYL